MLVIFPNSQTNMKNEDTPKKSPQSPKGTQKAKNEKNGKSKNAKTYATVDYR